MRNRFRAVEMGIFAVVSLIFLNSVYNLFMDGKLAGENERRPLAVQPKAREVASESREPASNNGGGLAGFVPYETKCRATGEVFETDAAKVRILGPFCGAGTPSPEASRQTAAAATPPEGQYHVENTTTRFVATVFSDTAAGKFSTDFIPLDSGPNRILMEFKYKGGRIFPVELTVIRKASL